jgi:uncharacterized protein YceH (UPF0502 family)
MYRIETLDDVFSTLQRLMQREPALVKVLPRQPGTKESRYMHLLAGDIEDVGGVQALPSAAVDSGPSADRIARLENEVAGLQNEVADLKQQFAEFRKQFE